MSKVVVDVLPVNAVPENYTCHCMEVVSNTTPADSTVGRLELHVYLQMSIGYIVTHGASSEVFKKTTSLSSSPLVYERLSAILHLIYVAEVS